MVKLKVNQPVEVDFNLHGQTIDGSSITLASYVGILVREHVSITLESWKKVDEQKKDMIWSSRLERSKNFRAMRLSQKTQHTTGRMGYVRLHHILLKRKEKITRVDVWIEGHKRKKNKPLSEAVQTTMDEINQLRESTYPLNDNNINEDSLAKVLGAEKRGRVRGLGFGATPSRAELKATNDQVASLKEMINMIIKQNDQVIWGVTNSKDKIHNIPLGRGYWRVWIDTVFIDIKVCRSTNEYEILSQAVGSSVVWLKDCIKIFNIWLSVAKTFRNAFCMLRYVIFLVVLERLFSYAFFDIMVHLHVHLAWEAKKVGHVQY
ncbi:hypothetical protein ACOSQ3_022373 [Xanthoceras sorbifolium]